MQMRPRPYRAMKLMASGVIFSAAIVRSPSFSRSSSSTTMIIRPSRIASIASSIGANGDFGDLRRFLLQSSRPLRAPAWTPALERARHYLPENIALDVDHASPTGDMETGVPPVKGNDLHVEPSRTRRRSTQPSGSRRQPRSTPSSTMSGMNAAERPTSGGGIPSCTTASTCPSRRRGPERSDLRLAHPPHRPFQIDERAGGQAQRAS